MRIDFQPAAATLTGIALLHCKTVKIIDEAPGSPDAITLSKFTVLAAVALSRSLLSPLQCGLICVEAPLLPTRLALPRQEMSVWHLVILLMLLSLRSAVFPIEEL